MLNIDFHKTKISQLELVVLTRKAKKKENDVFLNFFQISGF